MQFRVWCALSYNPSSQVITRQVSNGAYLYAPSAGTQTVTRNGLNQPVTIDGVSASSDARGNLTSDGVKSFVYDSANRLTGTGSSTLSYDPLDRMTQMVGTLGARYLYDGDEIAGVVVATTGTTIANRIVRGPGPDELLVAYQGNTASTPLWSLQDPQSSIIAITDAAGAAPYTLAYDEYGRPRSGNAGRLMYTGQLWMPDFGLYHYKARAYHPGLGRFVQTDPVGYEQGMNLYAYVGLDPMNATDPGGMQSVPPCIVDRTCTPTEADEQRRREEEEESYRLEDVIVTPSEIIETMRPLGWGDLSNVPPYAIKYARQAPPDSNYDMSRCSLYAQSRVLIAGSQAFGLSNAANIASGGAFGRVLGFARGGAAVAASALGYVGAVGVAVSSGDFNPLADALSSTATGLAAKGKVQAAFDLLNAPGEIADAYENQGLNPCNVQ